MGIEAEANAFMDMVDKLIDYTMVTDMTDAAVKEIQSKVQTEVYDKYTPRVYQRKKEKYGLLDPGAAPAGSMEIHYESQTQTLTVEDVREDWEPTRERHRGRNVAEVVESGSGYDWKDIPPRPFHKKAEEALINSGEADRVLQKAMDDNLAGDRWSL